MCKRSIHRLCGLMLIVLVVMSSVAQAGKQKWDALVRAANPLHWYSFNEAVGSTDAPDMGSGGLDGTYRSLVDLGQEGLLGAGDAALFEREGSDDIMWTQGGDVRAPEWTAEFIVMRLVDEGPTSAHALSDSADFSLRLVGWGVNNELSFTEYGVIDATFASVGGADLVTPLQEWIHVVYRKTATGIEVFLNGVLTGTTATNIDCPIDSFGGRSGSASDGMGGLMDEAVIYERALTDAEILEHAMAPLLPDVGALVLQPQDGATDVLRDTDLVWGPGIHAVTHNVYLGTAFAEVNDADTDTPLEVLVSQGQDATSLDAGVLDFDQTYYWRVDEVNGAPDNTVFKGDVWSFTVEPRAIQIETLTATASSSFGASGPEMTINGSGLADDLHGTNAGEMWISGGVPATIEYAFDRAYKLHEMWIWNSNQLIEAFVGFGAKDVVIEHSLDGENWTVLDGVEPLAQAPGTEGYAHNNTIDFGGTTAQSVRMTINSVQGIAPQVSLSEVRFYYIPTFATRPNPASGATDVAPDTALSWGRNGREAERHEVFFGSDPQNLSFAGSVSESSLDTAALDLQLGQTYSWRVDEVNDTMDPSTWTGDVWNFTTVDAISVDDMEIYADAEFLEIWATWVDGFDDPANGSLVGNGAGGTPETGIVHGGNQSLPMNYGTGAAALSEATRTFDAPMDWTGHGVQGLVLWFQGSPDNTGGVLYVRINDTRVAYDGDASNLMSSQWSQWYIPLANVAGDLSRVNSLTIGIDGGGAGVVYVDDISLVASAP